MVKNNLVAGLLWASTLGSTLQAQPPLVSRGVQSGTDKRQRPGRYLYGTLADCHTAWLTPGKSNQLVVEVTNVWANRLIGDEQEPADQTWLPGHLDKNSGYLKEFPDWFLNKQPRPSTRRYCFTTWTYFTKHSPLIPSGLLGSVRIIEE